MPSTIDNVQRLAFYGVNVKIEMENNQKKYIVYLTMNTINGKYYIGVHGTEDPEVFDGYLGCGAYIGEPSSYSKGKVPLHKAILKYGTKAFKRVTIKIFDDIESALNLEALIVTKEFISSPNNYNATVGGGLPPNTHKEVYQFDIKGNLIKKWFSAIEINDFYKTKVSITTIINEKRSFAGSFWSFSDNIDVSEFKTELNRGYINQYNLQGEFLNQYKNATIAAQKVDMTREEITRAVFYKRPHGGYYFLKADVDIAEAMSPVLKFGTKQVFRYLSTGEFDKEYNSTSAAVRDTPKAHTSSIRDAVVNGYLCGGYRWSYKKSDNYFNIESPKEDLPNVKIAQYDKQGNLIKIWNSPKECKKEFKYCLRVCQGSLKSTQNYIFKYVD